MPRPKINDAPQNSRGPTAAAPAAAASGGTRRHVVRGDVPTNAPVLARAAADSRFPWAWPRVLARLTAQCWRRAFRAALHSARNIAYYRHLMDVATNYEQWAAAALVLDHLLGYDKWKLDPVSPEYDYKLVAARLSDLKAAREGSAMAPMIFLLRTSLFRNLGDMGKPTVRVRRRRHKFGVLVAFFFPCGYKALQGSSALTNSSCRCFSLFVFCVPCCTRFQLFATANIGTKKLIEDYVDEVVKQINFICGTDSPYYSVQQKLEFFINTRQSFGRTALLLSGGATLGAVLKRHRPPRAPGLHHIGVVKCLYECKLLPRIISGTSSGSIIAAILCCSTDDDLKGLMRPESINLNFFHEPGEPDNVFVKLNRLLSSGVLFDVEVLKECVRSNIGDVTFQEAYNRTRRILNISVSSSGIFEMPRLLNYVTAPNVVIWSAVAASCAVPFVYSSAPLMAKEKGVIVAWNPSVNPHILPFLHSGIVPSRCRKIVGKCLDLARKVVQHYANYGIEYDICPNVSHRINQMLSQKYYGDITIVPKVGVKEYLNIIKNPTRDSFLEACLKGERATWSSLAGQEPPADRTGHRRGGVPADDAAPGPEGNAENGVRGRDPEDPVHDHAGRRRRGACRRADRRRARQPVLGERQPGVGRLGVRGGPPRVVPREVRGVQQAEAGPQRARRPVPRRQGRRRRRRRRRRGESRHGPAAGHVAEKHGRSV
ncbi:MAG: acyl transferase/acyl hydrolase/lysophospholipase [Olpidium bornovanus]|uniref:Patatin-like phospholipase domain-containing protein n=1 Tax=Olpidium bornovanus TaxID=278681 RepID=A0A8H8DM64_9FUNG|nr:MAG: acyl transferase/acyl hydrolase/lysophospholipase [Olpidium bornovanus]